ncbi:MAG: hypothetical protein GWN86_30505 [Desulfobacterales bacterium]|nr:hypothetical protein [Desulfobacterales bacterium]
MNSKDVEPIIEKFYLERLKIGARCIASGEIIAAMQVNPASVKAFADIMSDNVILDFVHYFAAQSLGQIEEKYPADWWQAFRERFFPKWWLKRWPVKHKVVKIEAKAIYPKIAMPKDRPYIIGLKTNLKDWWEQGKDEDEV